MPPTLLFAASPLIWSIGLPLAAGLVAIYLLLPRPRPFPAAWGGAAGGAALLLAGWLLVRTGGLTAESLLFYVFSGIAVLSGGLVITQSNPARAALAFALVVLSTCGLFLLLAAPFLMAATTLIYAGAIIVTFLFVLMLAQQEGPSDADNRSREPLLSTVAGFVLLGALLYVLQATYWNSRTAGAFDALNPLLERAEKAAQKSSAEEIALELNDERYFDEILRTLQQAPNEPRFSLLEKKVRSLDYQWLDLKMQPPSAEKTRFLKEALGEIQEEIVRARRSVGDLQPRDSLQLSAFSGPAPNDPVTRDEWGNAPLPAENVAFLGRSLFTDYLLAVELGGTLLLMATIGAIAIANQKPG